MSSHEREQVSKYTCGEDVLFRTSWFAAAVEYTHLHDSVHLLFDFVFNMSMNDFVFTDYHRKTQA
jgi:hypothetical protein